MCGICGEYVPEFLSPPDRTVLEEMTAALSHRGPDADGTYLDERIGLGHRRLSIIDLSSGAQPMYSADGSLVVVFNGEIYNYVELRDDLRLRGREMRTTSDTEVILHLYEEMGPRCVEQLNGMFAFAVWHTKEKRLLLARDRLGEKPLYYHFKDGRLVFASELKALLHHPALERRVNFQALDDYLAYGYVPADRCIIDGVSKLPPGCILKLDGDEVRVERYWDVRFEEPGRADEGDLLAELEGRLREAIRIRLRSDVPLGVFLSGGVDSSAVVAFASQATSGGRLKTFSVGFKEASSDETPFARMVAKHFQTDHTEIIVDDADISILSDLVFHLDEPFADPSALPTYFVCREARRHVTVCLSGDGGDELFAGYSRYVQAMQYHRWDFVSRLGPKQIAGALSRFLPPYFAGKGLLRRVSCNGADRYFAQCCKFSAAERVALLRPEFTPQIHSKPWLFEPFFSAGDRTPLLTKLLHSDQKTYLPDDILVKVDRMSMMSSLEVRVPFLDHTLVEFANRLPPELKFRDRAGKYLLKKMLQRHLPAEILHRKKMGFGIPIRNWFRGNLATYARETLLASDSPSHNWLRTESVERLLGCHLRGRRDLSRKIWTLLVLDGWLRRFGF